MASERATAPALIAVLLLVGAAAWWFELRPSLRVDASPLENLPVSLKSWRSRPLPVKDTVESMLRADFNLQRMYLHPVGEPIWVYVGYYGTRRGGHPEHTPAECYPSNGWTIEASRKLVVDPTLGLRAMEYIVERDGERRLVHYWYRSYRKTGMLGQLDLGVDHLLGRLRAGRADGALVRVSTPMAPGEEVAARSRLLGFETAFEAQLAEHWPRETPSS
jgi:EpsI family protein